MKLIKPKKIISFLVSGNGSNFKIVAENILNGHINANTGIVISSKSNVPALEKAEKMGIKSIIIDPKHFNTKIEYETEMMRVLKNYKTDLIITAGYMRILSPEFVANYKNKIINIHPSILPSFPGKSAQQQALDYGVKVTGCTTHFIDEGTDTGPIIMQSPVIINYQDNINTLSVRILNEEHKILSESVRLFCEDKIKIENNIVKIKK